MSSDLPLVPGFIARFIEQWASKRLPEARDHTTLVRQRIYILPTREGMIFFAVLLVILLGAINYENSLAFMLTFLTGSIGFLGMIYTHQNLNHLKISTLTSKPVFAGQTAYFPFNLSSEKPYARFNIKIHSRGSDIIHAHIKENADTQINLPVAASNRGRLYLNKIKIYSEFPLGLFHAWSWVELKTSCLVYPMPEAHSPRIHLRGKQSGQQMSVESGIDDFAGLRDYQKGDSPSHLAWKAIARTGQLQTKVFNADAGNEIWLSWYQLPDNMGIEKRLSVLCRWILDADNHGLSYGMEIPGKKIPVNSGLHHRHSCLRELALFGETDTS